MYKMKGYVVGVGFDTGLNKKDFSMEISEEEYERAILRAEVPNIQVCGMMDIKVIAADVYQGRKKIDTYEWVGDVDSCLADSILNE